MPALAEVSGSGSQDCQASQNILFPFGACCKSIPFYIIRHNFPHFNQWIWKVLRGKTANILVRSQPLIHFFRVGDPFSRFCALGVQPN